jgi:protein ImuB
LSFVFARLLDPLSAALEHADRGAAAIRLDLRLTDRTVHTRLLQLPAAMRDARVLRTLLLLDLESHPPAAAVDVVTIEADPAPARIIQYSLLERALPSAETIATLTARLDALVGADRCGSPVLLDTHRPDAFRMVTFSAGPRAQLERRVSHAAPKRRVVLRRFRPPVAVRVTLAQGRPMQVAIDRQGMPGGRVVQAAGPWRTSGGWWESAPWDGDEWDLTFRDGVACRISRDRLSGVWFLEGIFD